MTAIHVLLPGSPLPGAAAAQDINNTFASIISMFGGVTAPTFGPGAAEALVIGQDWLDFSVTPPVWRKWDGTQWVAIAAFDNANHVISPLSAPLSFRNLIGDNGGFEVWQRGAGSSASFSVGASTTAYTADRWYINTGPNEACTVAAVAGLTNNSNLAAKVTRNSGQTGTTNIQFGFPLDTDEIVRMRGQFIAVSFVAKAGANWSPASGVLQVFFPTGQGAPTKRDGVAYTTEVDVLSFAAALTTSPQTFKFASGSAVPIATTQAEMNFFWTPVGTAGADDSFTIDDVQVEIGTFATTFERVPFEKMLLGCKRHFWKSFLYGTAPAQNVGVSTGELFGLAGKAGATAGELILARNPVSMRATPAATLFNPAAANAQVRDETVGADCSATTVHSITTEHINVTATGNASTAVGDLIGIHVTVDAGI